MVSWRVGWKCVACMSASLSNQFAGIAAMAGDAFGVPTGLTLIPPNPGVTFDDGYQVDEDAFCRLVEYTMTTPRPVFYGWALYAAGIYEEIKGKEYRWSWIERGVPRPFDPLRLRPPHLMEVSDECIGLDPGACQEDEA